MEHLFTHLVILATTASIIYTLYKLRRDPSYLGPVEYQSTETMALLRSKSLRGEKQF